MLRRAIALCLLAACTSRAGPAPAPGAIDGPDCTPDTGAPDDTGAHDTGAHDTARDSGRDTSVVDTAADTDAPDRDTAIPWPPAAEIVVYAVRHAERAEDESDDPGLSEAGQARAEALAALLADAPLAAIYATDLRRTQDTVAPTAAAHGLPVTVEIDPEEALATHVLCTHAGETVLHAGHTDTLPAFLEGLGVVDPPSVSGYGQLWTVRVGTDGTVTLTEGHYGD